MTRMWLVAEIHRSWRVYCRRGGSAAVDRCWRNCELERVWEAFRLRSLQILQRS